MIQLFKKNNNYSFTDGKKECEFRDWVQLQAFILTVKAPLKGSKIMKIGGGYINPNVIANDEKAKQLFNEIKTYQYANKID